MNTTPAPAAKAATSDAVSPGAVSPLARLLWHPWLHLLVRLAVGGLFVVAGVNKLSDLEGFAYTIWEFDFMPEAWIDYVAYSLPPLEVLAGLGLACNLRGSLPVIEGMLAAFIILLGAAIAQGLDIDCGCFGAGDATPTSLHDALYRDLAMLAGCVYCRLWRWRRGRGPRSWRFWRGEKVGGIENADAGH